MFILYWGIWFLRSYFGSVYLPLFLKKSGIHWWTCRDGNFAYCLCNFYKYERIDWSSYWHVWNGHFFLGVKWITILGLRYRNSLRFWNRFLRFHNDGFLIRSNNDCFVNNEVNRHRALFLHPWWLLSNNLYRPLHSLTGLKETKGLSAADKKQVYKK